MVSLLVATLLVAMGTVSGQQEWSRWRSDIHWSPWDNYDNTVVVRTYFGDVRGFSVPWHIEDLNWDPDRPEGEEEYPPWFIRRINCFLGVPYAEPPVGKFRFMRTRGPRWGGTWEANHYRHACPQDVEVIRRDIPDFPAANVSEDCLHLNIFAPNITWHSRSTLYPVIVWIHSGDFVSGTSQTVPGHVLATREVVVVTFNYRLGAFGYLSTEDEVASGNWGLFDQHLALEFVKENIRAFRGDPDRITLAGDGAGAASVGFHLLSPVTRGHDFFHQTILMSGTDLSTFAWVDPYWQPRTYAHQLGELLGCGSDDSYVMVECLRVNDTAPWWKVVEAQGQVQAKDGRLGAVWAPTQDGGWFQKWPYLPQTPMDLRLIGAYDSLPCIIGLNTKDGAKMANDTMLDLSQGLSREEFQNYARRMLADWQVMPERRERVMEAVEFQYTYWPEPDNSTARAQELIDMLTDMQFGYPMDEVLKRNAEHQPTYMYEFRYQSYSDWVPRWMGSSHSSAVSYAFGFPFFNETILNETELVLRQYFDYEDRNMSDWMMYMWTNFAKYGRPTVNETRNITWEPFTMNNLSYLVMDEHSHIWFRYRQHKYGFWKEYFPSIAKQTPYFATPTPMGYEYVISTGSMSAIVILLLATVLALSLLLWWQGDQERRKEEMAESEIPLSFMTGSSSRLDSKETLNKTPPHRPVPADPRTKYNAPQPYYPKPYPGPGLKPYHYPTNRQNTSISQRDSTYAVPQPHYPSQTRTASTFQSTSTAYPGTGTSRSRDPTTPRDTSTLQSTGTSYPTSQRISYPPSNRSASSQGSSYPYSENEFSRSQSGDLSVAEGTRPQRSGQGYMYPRRKPHIPQHSVC